MSYNYSRPSYADISRDALNKANTLYDGVIPPQKTSFWNFMLKITVDTMHACYGILSFEARNSHISTCDAKFLEQLTQGVVKRIPATTSSGTIKFTGIDGSIIPANTSLTNNDGDKIITNTQATITNGVAIVVAHSVLTGSKANYIVGTQFGLDAGLIGVDNQATVTIAFKGGTDEESDESLRSRALQRQGQSVVLNGKEGDYTAWALQVANANELARVVEAKIGVPSIGEYVVMIGNLQNGVETALSQQVISQVISTFELNKPIGAVIDVRTIKAKTFPMAVNVTLDLGTLTPQLETQIKNAIYTYFDKSVKPLHLLTDTNKNEIIALINDLQNVKTVTLPNIPLNNALTLIGNFEFCEMAYPLLADITITQVTP